MTSRREPIGGVALALGPVVAIAVAGLLSRVRTDASGANVALALAIVVAVAALAGRAAGLTTAAAAALAYNFFHTEPYHSLRIHAARDVVTVALLATLGIIVSEVSAWRRREHTSAAASVGAVRSLEVIGEELADGIPPEQVWSDVRSALTELLHLRDCQFEPEPADVVIPRSGSFVAPTMRWDTEGFRLPSDGVSLPVAYRGRAFGHIKMLPDEQRGTSLVARQAAVTLADLYAVALATGRSAS